MRLHEYILRRIITIIPVLIGVTIIVFVIAYVIPTDPARSWAGPKARPEQVEVIRERYHLNDPVHIQLYHYFKGLLHGDLGISPTTHRPVLEDLKDRFPATFELTIFAFILAVVIGLPLGVVSALKRNKPIDHLSRFISLMGVSTPLFWFAMMLQLIFYYRLGWLPASGRIDVEVERITGFLIVDSIMAGNMPALLSTLWHLVLPATCMAFWSLAYFVRITRSSMLENLEADYATTAKAKGLPERIVNYKHVLRNAIIAPVTILGIQFGWLLMGSVLLETIVSWPGMGRYAADTIVQVDLPAIAGYCLVVALIMVIANLITDILYVFIDPRVRLGEKAK